MIGLVGKLIAKLLLGLALAYLNWLMAPKPKPPKASTLDDFNIPRADEGEELGKVYGTVWVNSPKVHWYGHLRSVPIKEKTGK